MALTIVQTSPNWGSEGRAVDLHRIQRAWDEMSVTWNCPIDSDLSNQGPDCPEAWDIAPGGDNPWVTEATDSVWVTNSTQGTMRLDVTEDVAALLAGDNSVQGWIVVKRDESLPGSVRLLSSESTAPPALVLEVLHGQVVD